MENYSDKRFISVEELANIMGISKSQAYKLVHSETLGFKVLAIGTRIIIPLNSFNNWYNSLADTDEIEGEAE